MKSYSDQQHSPAANDSSAATRETLTGSAGFPSTRLASPTDDQVAEHERLIHAACRLRRELRATDVPTISQLRDYKAAVAAMNAHRANFFEGESVPA